MKKYPVLISIPHASLFVPKEVRDNVLLDKFHFRDLADLYTDDIFEVPNAFIVQGNISRLIVNLNRAPDSIEEDCAYSVMAMRAPDGQKVFREPLSMQCIHSFIEQYHKPFHEEIKKIVKKQKIKFFIDGHSMWSVRPPFMYGSDNPRSDICLGNREFTSCTEEHTYAVQSFFLSKGYSVKINDPYSGKYNVGYHCHRDGLPGMQIEINRKIFMDEGTLKRYPKKIKKLNQEIEELVEMISEKF